MSKMYKKEQPEAIKPPGSYLREHGIILLNGHFEEAKIVPIIAQIIEYNLMPKSLQPNEIKLIINSLGGLLNLAWQLVDAIETSELTVVTVGQGSVASAGLLTLMSGDKRFVTRNTAVMSHTYSGGASGKEGELYSTIKSFEMASDNMLQHYMKITKKSEKYIRKHLLSANDVWLTPEECLKHGLIDGIWD